MLIKLKPNTPGQRGTVLVSKKHLSKDKPYKTLTKSKYSSVNSLDASNELFFKIVMFLLLINLFFTYLKADSKFCESYSLNFSSDIH